MEKVAEILDAKYPQFNTVSPSHTIHDALSQMCYENVEYLIVMEDQKYVGILTEHDITNKILFNKRPLDEILVKDFMSTQLPVASPNDTLEYCMQILERNNHRYLAVYDQFDFKGILSTSDIMQQVLRKRRGKFEKIAEKEEYSWNY